MNVEVLKKRFGSMGVPLVVGGLSPNSQRDFRLDVLQNKKLGEHYSLLVQPRAYHFEFNVVNVDVEARHLLLVAKEPVYRGSIDRFLCGHDERHWFVATVPTPVATVSQAKRALLPPQLRSAALTQSHLNRRHNEVFKRQGEWFFVPADVNFSGLPILKNERLLRERGGKAHVVDEMVRFGGVQVVLHGGNEYRISEWDKMVAANPTITRQRHQKQVKDAEVYVRGNVRHPDHATIKLYGWHRVLLNGEILSINQGFYD